MLPINDSKKTLEENWALLIASKDQKMLPALRMLHERMENPRSYVTMAGETSSGKSTLINAFLQRKLLKAGAKPTTGTVTWIEYGVGTEDKFYAINRNAQIAQISAEEFDKLTVEPNEQLLRLKLQVPGDKKKFQGLTIFDTPGFNSIIIEHEEVLKEFLPESDVVVFSVSYRMGFGQMDQELMSLIAGLPTDCGEVPVILVVNRVPKNISISTDPRIREIKSHATDSLHRPLKHLLLVHSSLPDENKCSTLPNADELWEKVGNIAFSQERKDSFVKKCNEILVTFFKQRMYELQGDILAAENPEGVEKIEKLRDAFLENRGKSFEVIEKYTNRIMNNAPKIIETAIEDLLDEINMEIDDASKWIDIQDCSNYILNHKIPFGTRGVTKKVSEYIFSEIEMMDTELSEMANKAVLPLNEQAQLHEHPEMTDLIKNLSLRIGHVLLGKTAGAVARSFGGVGGLAAGTGNLVKMGVKQVGKLFNHTFSRQVYTNIGKIFTKKMMNAIAVGTDVVIEIFSYLRESNKWQGELKAKTLEVIRNWEQEAVAELLENSIPSMQENNREIVTQIYDDSAIEFQRSIDSQKTQITQAEIEVMRNDITKIKQVLSILTN